MVLEAAWLRTWADGEGFHALHWNMLSWSVICNVVFRGFLLGWVERVAAGDFMLWLGRAVVERSIGERVCGALGACCLAFFGGLFGGSGGGD